MTIALELKKFEFPVYYGTLCSFTCPRCGGLIVCVMFVSTNLSSIWKESKQICDRFSLLHS